MDNKTSQNSENPRKTGQDRVSGTKPSEDQRLVDKSSWMIRPCSVYDAEKWECMKPRGRFYQYYINGELADCAVWVHLAKNCRKWMKNDDVVAGAEIIRHEKELIERRVQSRLQNDIWVRRDDSERPPSNWYDPLPPHITEKHEDSYLADHAHEPLPPLGIKTSWCSIS